MDDLLWALTLIICARYISQIYFANINISGYSKQESADIVRTFCINKQTPTQPTQPAPRS